VPGIVDPSDRVDREVALCWLPVAVAEVVQVDVAAAWGGEQELLVLTGESVERLERDRLERDRTVAGVRLGVLDPAVAVGAADVDDALPALLLCSGCGSFASKPTSPLRRPSVNIRAPGGRDRAIIVEVGQQTAGNSSMPEDSRQSGWAAAS
jgi:hypothetical protein